MEGAPKHESNPVEKNVEQLSDWREARERAKEDASAKLEVMDGGYSLDAEPTPDKIADMYDLLHELGAVMPGTQTPENNGNRHMVKVIANQVFEDQLVLQEAAEAAMEEKREQFPDEPPADYFRRDNVVRTAVNDNYAPQQSHAA